MQSLGTKVVMFGVKMHQSCRVQPWDPILGIINNYFINNVYKILTQLHNKKSKVFYLIWRSDNDVGGGGGVLFCALLVNISSSLHT